MSTITIGVDLAKSVFSVCEAEGSGRVLKRQDLRREPFAPWLANCQPARWWRWKRAAGHHWARRCLAHGLQPPIMAPIMAAQFIDQQVQLSRHRVREGYKVESPMHRQTHAERAP